MPTATASKPGTPYPPLTPTEAALELGVALTQRQHPNLRDAVPKRLVSAAESEARGWSWYFDGGSTCRYGHVAARRTANPRHCSDCERVKDGEEPVYGKSRTQKYYEKPRRPAKDPAAPVVIAAPAAPPAQVEPTRKEQDFLAALDETRDFDVAAQRTNFSRSQIEARASVNEVFRKALTDLCERRGIAWTRTPDAASFQWSPEIERQLVKRFIDTGLLQTAREELGIAASDFFAHMESAPTFAAAIEAARPRAREVLRDRATQGAERGNVNLLKLLEEDAPTDISNMSHTELNAELQRLLNDLDARGFFPKVYIDKKTGRAIDRCDLIPAEKYNADLVGAE
jgi:hypothetical protein